MKKTMFLVAALALVSTTAMASKARRTAINNSTMVATDVQEVFTNPSKLTKVSDLVTFEWGATATAEGGFIDTMGSGKLGFYLGRDNSFNTLGSAAGLTNAYLANPFDIMYAQTGDMPWGLGLHYGSGDFKTTSEKHSEMSLSAGIYIDAWSIALYQSLGAKAEKSTVVATGTAGTSLSVSYKMSDTHKPYLKYTMSGYKKETSSTLNTDYKATTTQLGIEGKKGAMVYGIEYKMVASDDAAVTSGASKTDTTTLPMFVGVEADAASWLVLRGSVSQNLFLGSTKTGSNDANTTADNTTIAAGLGLKFDKFMLDGTFSNTNSGTFGVAENFANAALTYMF